MCVRPLANGLGVPSTLIPAVYSENKRPKATLKWVWPHQETINNGPTESKPHYRGNRCAQCLTMAPKEKVFWWPSGHKKYLGTAEKLLVYNRTFPKMLQRDKRAWSSVTKDCLWDQGSMTTRLFQGTRLLVRTCKIREVYEQEVVPPSNEIM